MHEVARQITDMIDGNKFRSSQGVDPFKAQFNEFCQIVVDAPGQAQFRLSVCFSRCFGSNLDALDYSTKIRSCPFKTAHLVFVNISGENMVIGILITDARRVLILRWSLLSDAWHWQ